MKLRGLASPALSHAGLLLAGFHRDGILLQEPDGTERWHVTIRGSIVTFSEDDTWLVVVERQPRRIVVRVLASADGTLHAEREIPRDHYIESFHAFGCFRGRFEIDDLSLSLPALDTATRTERSLRISRGDRFVLHGSSLWYGLLDEARDRYVLLRDEIGRSMAACGHFALVPKHRKCLVHDLVLDTVTDFEIRSTVGKAYASDDGRRLLISSSHPELFELDWERGGDCDLATAWGDHPRPPIVDHLLPQIRSGYRTVTVAEQARNHPELELALAAQQRPSEGRETTRRLLQHPTIAAMPSAWAQLARMSLQLEHLDEAADAAAEALGRDEDDASLHALLAQVQRARQAPRVAPIEPLTRWRAHGRLAYPIVTIGDRVATLGTEENGDEWLRLWRGDGELVGQHLVGKQRRSCGNRIGATEHLLLCTTDDGVVSFARDQPAAPARIVVAEAEPWKRFDFGSDGHVVGVIGRTTLCWTTPSARLAQVTIEPEPYEVRVLDHDALLLYSAHEHRKPQPRLERRDRAGGRETVAVAAYGLLVDDLVYAAGDGELHRWTTALEPLPSLAGHRAPLFALAHRGDLLASIDRAGSLRFWRGERAVAAGVAHDVTTLAITDDESTLALHRDGTVSVWPAP